MKTAIIYLGTRGAPNRQLNAYSKSLESGPNKIIFVISSKNREFLNLPEKQHLLLIDLPSNKTDLILNYNKKNAIISNLVSELYLRGVTRVFFIMPHPWNLVLARKLKQIGIKQLWTAVHELEPHKGEIWPSKRFMNQIILESSDLVVHSEFIENKVKKYEKTIHLTRLFEITETMVDEHVKKDVLFIGRIKKYKGLSVLLKAWKKMETKDMTMTIAGHGFANFKFILPKNVDIINKWLTDREIESLISTHSVVVLPYSEASQSGIIPICTALKRPVVVTPVGGLTEQVISGITGIIAASHSAADIASALTLALDTKWKIPTLPNPIPEFLEELLND